MKNIIDINYEVTVNRGLISKETKMSDFVMKLEEEVQEFIDAALNGEGDEIHELADIVLVCLNIAKHYSIDIEKQLLINIAKNVTRV